MKKIEDIVPKSAIEYSQSKIFKARCMKGITKILVYAEYNTSLYLIVF